MFRLIAKWKQSKCRKTYVWACICIYMCIYMYMHTCMYICIYVCLHTYTYNMCNEISIHAYYIYIYIIYNMYYICWGIYRYAHTHLTSFVKKWKRWESNAGSINQKLIKTAGCGVHNVAKGDESETFMKTLCYKVLTLELYKWFIYLKNILKYSKATYKYPKQFEINEPNCIPNLWHKHRKIHFK